MIIPNYTISLCDKNDRIYVGLCKALCCCLGAFCRYYTCLMLNVYYLYITLQNV